MKCGLLGEKLGHSYSPMIHAALADYEYLLYEKSPAELEDFLLRGDWDALNVTIPYKKAVMPYCAELSDAARRCGSVNTLLRLPDGGIRGENTDTDGFRFLLRSLGFDPSGKKSVILGSGGAAAAVRAVLEEEGASEIVTVSRRGEDNYETLARHADARFVVNATPVGMFPHNGEAVCSLRSFPRCEAAADLIYNPARSALLLEAEELGIRHVNGLGMLVAQAKRSCELFCGRTIPEGEITRIEETLSRRMRNIVLIGMPGCGKSTIGKLLAEATGRVFCEADALAEREAGLSIPEIFRRGGEDAFRARETAVLTELGRLSGCVIATGGGCVTREENYPLLHQNAVIVWLQRDLGKLPKEGRPISLGSDLNELYARRRPLYERFCDLTVPNDGTPEETVHAILKKTV
ncbi:MAG: shikimate kinase [Oscillospiraceae bacterium]|nr:shikimate kinase [Oscillospiraceae bacterium]